MRASYRNAGYLKAFPETEPRRSALPIGGVRIKPDRSLELVSGTDLTAGGPSAGRDGAVRHKPWHRVKSVGNIDADGTFVAEEAAGHSDGGPARTDRGGEPVRRQRHRNATPFFLPHIIDL